MYTFIVPYSNSSPLQVLVYEIIKHQQDVVMVKNIYIIFVFHQALFLLADIRERGIAKHIQAIYPREWGG